MKIGIMQPYFLPYIGYFQLIHAVDKYVVYDDVNYIKGGWINRNRILTKTNEPQFINIRMEGASSNKLINQINVIDDSKYINKLLRTIEMNYKDAPYFNQTYKMIKQILECDERNLALFLYNSLKIITSTLGIETEMILSSTLNKNNELKGREKVIEICTILNGDTYINTIVGQDLYEQSYFNDKRIKLEFLKPKGIIYDQKNREFLPNLSILDVMMYNSTEAIREMLDQYQLVNN